MQSDEILCLVHGTTAYTAQFLHVSTNTEQKTQVHAECTDIGSSLTADPEDTEVAVVVELDQLALVNGTDTQLTLDGGDQRRALEEGTGQGLEGTGELGLAARQLVVESNDGDILLSGTLLGLDQAGGTVDTDNQTTSDLGVKGSRVTGLLNTEDSLDPSDNFVTGGVRGLVQVDDTGANVRLEVAVHGRAAMVNGGEVTSSDEHWSRSRSASGLWTLSDASAQTRERRRAGKKTQSCNGLHD